MPTTSGASTSIANQMSSPARLAEDRRVAADHHELAVREVDDAHHPEHDRQPGADQREEGDHVEDLEEDDGGVVHGGSRSSTTPQIVTSNCLFSFGFFARLHDAAVSLGGRCLNACLIVSFWPLTSITLMSSEAWWVFGSILTRPAGPFDADAGLEHLDQLLAVERAGLLDRLGPQLDALVLRDRDLVHDLGVAEALAPSARGSPCSPASCSSWL